MDMRPLLTRKQWIWQALKPGTRLPEGQVEIKNGKLTGILIDNAIELVTSKIPAPTSYQFRRSEYWLHNKLFCSSVLQPLMIADSVS